MDLKTITDAAGDLVEKVTETVTSVPGVTEAVDAVQDAAGHVHAAAGDMLEKATDAVEEKIGSDIDGDGDMGGEVVPPATV